MSGPESDPLEEIEQEAREKWAALTSERDEWKAKAERAAEICDRIKEGYQEKMGTQGYLEDQDLANRASGAAACSRAIRAMIFDEK